MDITLLVEDPLKDTRIKDKRYRYKMN